jgi:hypothetical protein
MGVEDPIAISQGDQKTPRDDTTASPRLFNADFVELSRPACDQKNWTFSFAHFL